MHPCCLAAGSALLGEDGKGIHGIPVRHLKGGRVSGGYSPSPLLYRAPRQRRPLHRQAWGFMLCGSNSADSLLFSFSGHFRVVSVKPDFCLSVLSAVSVSVSADVAKTMCDQIAFAVFSWTLAVLQFSMGEGQKKVGGVLAQPIFFGCLSEKRGYISAWCVLCGFGVCFFFLFSPLLPMC